MMQAIKYILNERNRNIQRQMSEIQAEKELVEKARVSKDEFISNVTHEMNTPLTSIHGYAELLQAENTLLIFSSAMPIPVSSTISP